MTEPEFWQRKGVMALMLWPLSIIYCLLTTLRRQLYRLAVLEVHQTGVPVIVIGNITAGGAGKTPLVIWLVERLKAAGYRPGIVSRGYRGKSAQWPRAVSFDSDPVMVGDEPVLLAKRCACPVVTGPDRPAAVRMLLDNEDCNVLISDDGLQHYALGRDIEIAVIDGRRRFGNGFCLPAGPLREKPARLQKVDAIVVNGGEAGKREYSMRLQPAMFRNIRDKSQMLTVDMLAGRQAHAVAGIGDPSRFFALLKELGMKITEHPFPDHYAFSEKDLVFGDALPVIMTEKDAVKCSEFVNENAWYLQVEAEADDALERRIIALLDSRLSGQTMTEN